jgi:hypothetical protein
MEIKRITALEVLLSNAPELERIFARRQVQWENGETTFEPYCLSADDLLPAPSTVIRFRPPDEHKKQTSMSLHLEGIKVMDEPRSLSLVSDGSEILRSLARQHLLPFG